MRHSSITRLPSVAACAALVLFVGVAPAPAGDEPPGPARQDVLQRLRSGRLRAAAGAGPVQAETRPLDARADEVVERFRAGLDALRSADVQAPRGPHDRVERRTRDGRRVVGRTRTETRDDVTLRRRPDSRTPRLIRGRALQRRVASGGTAEERDVATARALLRNLRHRLRIENPDAEFRVRRVDTDARGRRHVRFAQRYRGVDVWPSELVVQVDEDGDVDTLTGAFVPTPRKLAVRAVVDAETAIARAREELSAGPEATVSEPELVVNSLSARLPRLGWRMDVEVSHGEAWRVVVDAHTGELLEQLSLIMDADVAGSGVDVHGQTRNIRVWSSGGTHFAVDASKSMFDPASSPPNLNTTRGGIVVHDARNTGTGNNLDGLRTFDVTSVNPNAGWLADAVSASYGLSETFDYYAERHGRNSLDGQGGTIFAIVRGGSNFDNAFWFNNRITFGDGDTWAGSLDFVGHELTHGITEKTSNLVYMNQSGALNEAFSDIFGEMIESYSTGGANDWLMGTGLSRALRNLKNPNAIEIQPGLPYPKKMSQYIDTQQDNGGVHLNSSIINHAFYLLAEGLPGAIGKTDAARIFYRTNTTKLSPRSQFIDCRLGAIASAEDLFGQNSAQAQKVAEAFDAVEIFGSSPTPPPTPAPEVNGPDSTLFVRYFPGSDALFLHGRESALGDGPGGTALSQFDVAFARPSVTGDGSLAVFVDSINDVCLVATNADSTNPAEQEVCLGLAGSVHSVAMSPAGDKLAFVLLDGFGNPDDSITVYDVPSETSQNFVLRAPVFDGASSEIAFADVMDFTADGQILIYDAFNVLTFADGQYGLWSIYGIDLASGELFSIVAPTPGLDLGNPSLSQTIDRFLTFEAFEPATGDTTVVSMDLFTNTISGIVTISSATTFSYPGYTGDDAALVFTAGTATNTGSSLFRIGLGADRLTPAGNAELWLQDATLGIVYRRGEYTPPPTPPAENEDLLFTTGAPRLESLSLDVPVGAATIPVDLELAHTPRGGYACAGVCTVAGTPVRVGGSLRFIRRRGVWRYNLVLTARQPRTRVTVRGDVGSGAASVTYRGPAGRGRTPLLAISESSFQPTSRLKMDPTVDFRGRIGGLGNVLGGFGSDANTLGRLSGRLFRGGDGIRLRFVDRGARQTLNFVGFRQGNQYVGNLRFVVPPARGLVFDFVVPDVFTQ